VRIFKRQQDYADRSRSGVNRSAVDAFNERVIQQTINRSGAVDMQPYVDANLKDNRFNKVDWVLKQDGKTIGYAESKVRQNARFPLWLNLRKVSALYELRAKHRSDDLYLSFYWGIIDLDGNDKIYRLRLWSPDYKYDLSKCKVVWGGTRSKVKSNVDQEWVFEIPKSDLTEIDNTLYLPVYPNE
tara:strand:- start:369 stop:923 length:555 start_codon:yes stop_codon:yes gene_type:complete